MEKLIEMVRGFPALYDTSHEDYMRAKLKDDLFEKIAKKLNYTDAQAAKEQWRKLRESHREALRRQQKKSGQQTKHIRLWMYQKQMEFLTPFMKNRTTVGYPTSPPEKNQLIASDDDGEPMMIKANEGEPKMMMENDGNDSEPNVEPENVAPKRFKKSTIDPVIQKFIEDSERKREELRQYLVVETQKQDDLQNNALYQFFMSMFNITKGLSKKSQKEVRRKLFQAVSDAEDKAEDEIADRCKVEPAEESNTGRSGGTQTRYPLNH